MSKKHSGSYELGTTNNESNKKPYIRNAISVVAIAGAATSGIATMNHLYKANAVPQPEVAEQVYGIDPETQDTLMQIQKQWDHDTAPMAPHEIPESVLKASGFANFTIEQGAGGAAEQAKLAYAELYNIPVQTLSPEVNQSIDITAKSYARVHGGDELGILEVTNNDTDEKYVVVTDEIRLDTN